MKNILKSILVSGLMLIPIGVVNASENVEIKSNPALQQTFIKAEKALAKQQVSSYKALYHQLHYYPLQPYLEQQQLLNNMQLSSAGNIKKFLDKYKATPLDWPLRKAWLIYLAKHDQKILFRDFYRETNNTELQCSYLDFSLNTSTSEKLIYKRVTKLWLTGKSLDKACDPLLDKWAVAGYRTDELVLERIALAANGGKHTLIPYLTSLLPEEKKYLGHLWHEARRNPASVTKLTVIKNDSHIESEIYEYGIKRLIWRDPDLAISSYNKANKLYSFSAVQKQIITEKFVVALTSKKHDQADTWLNKLDEKSISKSILQVRLVDTLKSSSWEKVIGVLDDMPLHFKSELQWKYWYARALIETNEIEQGEKLMLELASTRHYYGFLAAGNLDKAVSLEDDPLSVSKAEKQAILQYPAAKRAFELFYLERYTQARREWDYWLSQLNDKQKLAAAKLANENGWFDRTIFTLSKVGYLNDVELRFPKAYDKEIKEFSDKQAINPAWAFAIARRESSFMTDANSSVGAKGLMQLMPKTAKQLKRGSVSKNYLYNAENNIKLGTKYLRKLLDKNKGNRILATASYNAGPYRVKKWLKETNSMPADVWIETIPFKETRDYVKSVLAYQEIYQHKPGQVSEIFEEVINMDIGNKVK